MQRSEPNFVLWFLWSGIIGFVVALLFALLRFCHIFWGFGLQLILWPASIFGMGFSSGIGSSKEDVAAWVLMMLLTLGSNFIVYAVLGAGLRFVWSLVEGLFSQRSAIQNNGTTKDRWLR